MNNSFMLPSVVIILLILCLTFLATLHMVLTHRADAAAAAADARDRYINPHKTVVKAHEQACKLLDDLKAIPGAVDYDSDSAGQVVFFLKDGKTLRIGYGEQGLWVDQYEGLAIKCVDKTTGQPSDTTDLGVPLHRTTSL